MSLVYMEQIRGYPYMSVKQIAKEMDCSPRTVFNRIQGIKAEIKRGRYNSYAILESDRSPRINLYAYIDFEKYWKLLTDKNARKYVPEFRPDEIAEICGFRQNLVTMEGEDEANNIVS